MYLTYLSDIIYYCLGICSDMSSIFLKQKCILPDILLMSGILCMTVYLAFWHSIWQIFSDILFDIHLALRFYVSCSDLLFAVLLVILFDMHGMAFCLTLIGSSAGRLPKITDDFTGDPWLQIRGVSRMACVIRLGLYDMSQHSVYSRPMELPWKGCCAPLWRHIISRGSTKRWSGFLQSDGDVLLKSLLSITSPAYPIGSMVLLYMVTWIPSIYPLYVSIYTSTMDPMGIFSCFETSLIF